MRISALTVFASAVALAATPAIAAAAAKPAAKPAATAAAAAPAQAQVQDAMLYLKVLISGLQSDKVEQPVKSALVGCLYDNSLGKITDSMDKIIAANPGKIHRDNPSELLSVMAQMCGYKPTGAPGAAAKPGTTGR